MPDATQFGSVASLLDLGADLPAVRLAVEQLGRRVD
jgi:hypothetical protein